MYEYNFDEKRNNIEEILKNSIEESREKYYFELESFNNEEKQSHDKGIKKKKTIIKNLGDKEVNYEKEIIDFEDIDNLKFETFYNVGFGLFDMTSSAIYKYFENIKFEYVIFKNCVFKNVQFENCVFLGCEFLDCKFLNTKFKSSEFFDALNKNITYFYNSDFENCTFDKSCLKRAEIGRAHV